MLSIFFVLPAQNEVLIPENALWNYLDDGSNQGQAWRNLLFFDNNWSTGEAQLGYGDGDEVTIISSGPEIHHVTTYFRHAFQAASADTFPAILRLLRDDGAIVYLNGLEIARSNMSGLAPTFLTLASSRVIESEEDFWYTFTIPALAVNAGKNVLAVEIHQYATHSTDISFDLELLRVRQPYVIRGPYLQMGTPNSLTVKWRTFLPGKSEIRYGLTPDNLDSVAVDTAMVVNHLLQLSDLKPNTKYYYLLFENGGAAPGAAQISTFVTAPKVGTSPPIRIWALGDCGTGNARARAVRDAYYDYVGQQHTDMVLLLGDNAYLSGTDLQYQNAIFEGMYEEILRKTVTWSCTGNHDLLSASSALQSGPYYDIFSFPKQGEAGGLASGTEAYYSFNYGNIHFISLDSQGSDRSSSGPMMTWLQNDLAANSSRWIIAFWHHPPYTKGSHNSDNVGDSGGRMADMRQTFLPVLEAAGVDLVLSGHSHSYERSFLLNGHYGLSVDLTLAQVMDSGDGRVDGDGAYRKAIYGSLGGKGAVYLTAGSSGKVGGGALNHPAHFVGIRELGSVVIEVNNDQLDLKFLNDLGLVRDYFTLFKDQFSIAADYQARDLVKLDVFPNPVAAFVNLNLPRKEYGRMDCNVTNMEGKVVHQESFTGQFLRLDIQNLPKGVYLVNVIPQKSERIYWGKIVLR